MRSTPDSKIRVLHVITGLNTGGAEMVLYRLIEGMDRSEFANSVISLTSIGPIGDQIRALGAPVRALGLSRRSPNPLKLLELASWLRRSRPDVIQSWMYHADLLAGLAAKMAGGYRVVWGIRHAKPLSNTMNSRTIRVARLCARLSHRLPARIVYCSEAAHAAHARIGYADDRFSVITNGYDLDHFKPDAGAGSRLRKDLDIQPESQVIGLVARFHPDKDHRNFVSAAAELAAARDDVHFALCGTDVNWDNRELAGWIEDTGYKERFHLLGNLSNANGVTAGFDIATLSSVTEAFPNVVGEAMACGVPCVVTDVGDAALIVGETGKVVPPRNPDALAAAWSELLDLPENERKALGERARERIARYYDLNSMIKRYEALYREVAGDVRPGRID